MTISVRCCRVIATSFSIVGALLLTATANQLFITDASVLTGQAGETLQVEGVQSYVPTTEYYLTQASALHGAAPVQQLESDAAMQLFIALLFLVIGFGLHAYMTRSSTKPKKTSSRRHFEMYWLCK